MKLVFKFLIVLVVIVALFFALRLLNYGQKAPKLENNNTPVKIEPKIMYNFGGTIEEIKEDGLIISATAKQNSSFIKDRRYYLKIDQNTKLTPGVHDLIISVRKNDAGEVVVTTKPKEENLPQANPNNVTLSIARWSDFPTGTFVSVVGDSNVIDNDTILAKWIFY